MRIIENSGFARAFLPDGYSAIMLFGVVFAKGEMNRVSRCHEAVHVWQWEEVSFLAAVVMGVCALCGLLPWWALALSPSAYYVWYMAEFGVRCAVNAVRLRKWDVWGRSYYDVCFEHEAYQWQWDAERRKRFGWLWRF